MKRREFLGMSMGALAVGALAGCGSSLVRGAAAASAATPTDAAAFRAARRYMSTRFGDIAYVDRGSGAAVLFLHGFPLNSFQWRGVIDRLSPFRRCIAPDSLGLGYTRVAAGQSVAPSAQIEMLATLLDNLGIADVDLIANDSGGAVAQLFVARYPQRVRSLLLTNCDTELDCPPPALQPVLELSEQGKFVQEWLAPWLADKTLARSPQGLGGMTFTYPSNPTDEAIDYYLTPLVQNPDRTHAYALALKTNVLAGVEPALRQFQAPTRILWGTGDTIFSAESPDYLNRTFGNSRGVRRVPGGKLFWPEEFPALIAEEAQRLWGIG